MKNDKTPADHGAEATKMEARIEELLDGVRSKLSTFRNAVGVEAYEAAKDAISLASDANDLSDLLGFLAIEPGSDLRKSLETCQAFMKEAEAKRASEGSLDDLNRVIEDLLHTAGRTAGPVRWRIGLAVKAAADEAEILAGGGRGIYREAVAEKARLLVEEAEEALGK